MIYKSKQFKKLMTHYLSENISDTDVQLLLGILNSDPNYKARYSEMVKTRTISLTPAVKAHKTSIYRNLLQLLNKGWSLNSQPKFVHYFIRVAVIIINVFDTSALVKYKFESTYR